MMGHAYLHSIASEKGAYLHGGEPSARTLAARRGLTAGSRETVAWVRPLAFQEVSRVQPEAPAVSGANQLHEEGKDIHGE